MDAGILILGCGKMGGALLSGWLDAGWAKDRICVVEAYAPTRESWQSQGLATVVDVADVPKDFIPDVVMVAVKPQTVDVVLPALSEFLKCRCPQVKPMVLSILAGTPVAVFSKALGEDVPVLRVMPNTPAAVKRGVSGLFASSTMCESQKALGARLLSAVGEVVWLPEEDQMHGLTAVSGSGPAYVFYMVEAMAAAGVELGLEPDISMKLARQTIIGSAELLRQSSEGAEQLRINVTSPGGTTAEALAVLMQKEDGLTPLMTKALKACADKSRELAGE